MAMFRQLTLAALERQPLASFELIPLATALRQRLERTSRWEWASQSVKDDLRQQSSLILADQATSTRLAVLTIFCQALLLMQPVQL